MAKTATSRIVGPVLNTVLLMRISFAGSGAAAITATHSQSDRQRGHRLGDRKALAIRSVFRFDVRQAWRQVGHPSFLSSALAVV